MNTEQITYIYKFQLFWEGHKSLRNLPYGFDIYLVNVKNIRQIALIFVAFSEKLNFNEAWIILNNFDETFEAVMEKLVDTTLQQT